MKSYALKTLFLLLILSSCGKHNFLEENLTQKTIGSLRAPYKISIDSSYAYHGDSLYRVMAREYYSDSSKSASIKTQRKTHKSNVAAAIQKQNMTPEDEASFKKIGNV